MNELANPLARRRRIGHRLRYWRRQRHMSQAELARSVGVTQASLSHYEAGKRDPSLGIFMAIVKVLDIAPDDILRP